MINNCGMMKKVNWLNWMLLLVVQLAFSQKYTSEIKRDSYGVPHVWGKTDADAVFGLMYAQCEDDFERVEMNYIEKLGRLSELNGDKDIYSDLLIRLLIDENEAKKEYKNAPKWLKDLLDAYAAGINYYLATNKAVKPKLLSHFEPWFPLLWTDGSIGAISTAELGTETLKVFYEGNEERLGLKAQDEDYEQTGSNGFAIGPQKSESGKAMLYINPHTTFYFRPEVHVKSDDGLNAYGAVTWGQFFVYQGFNENCGWMHTSSNADVADVYLEKVIREKTGYKYLYDGKFRKMKTKEIKIKYLTSEGLKESVFIGYYTHRGPVMGKKDGNWLSLTSYNRSQKSLEQSWLRTKATGLDDYKKVMDMKANTSNNTVFADKHGNIAYWHGNYMPVRDKNKNWSQAQEGWLKSNDYGGLHEVKDIVHIYNPKIGWIQNCNSTPFTVSGEESPKKSDYPSYMAPDGENFRGFRAAELLRREEKLNLEELISLGYDRYLKMFEVLIPELARITEGKYEGEVREALDSLKSWNYYAEKGSVATAIAIEWAQQLNAKLRKVYINPGENDQVQNANQYIKEASTEELVGHLQKALDNYKERYGTWKVQWGDINRFQRINNKISGEHDDARESIAVANASALWGSLPSFNSRIYAGTKKRYGYSGNSFVCAVEFGEKVKAKSLLAGGNSGDVNSAYFNNQGKMYAEGQFKEVLFYQEDIDKNVVKQYKVEN
jgi:acyl-homoserine lactone acylase PvdQ